VFDIEALERERGEARLPGIALIGSHRREPVRRDARKARAVDLVEVGFIRLQRETRFIEAQRAQRGADALKDALLEGPSARDRERAADAQVEDDAAKITVERTQLALKQVDLPRLGQGPLDHIPGIATGCTVGSMRAVVTSTKSALPGVADDPARLPDVRQLRLQLERRIPLIARGGSTLKCATETCL